MPFSITKRISLIPILAALVFCALALAIVAASLESVSLSVGVFTGSVVPVVGATMPPFLVVAGTPDVVSPAHAKNNPEATLADDLTMPFCIVSVGVNVFESPPDTLNVC